MKERVSDQVRHILWHLHKCSFIKSHHCKTVRGIASKATPQLTDHYINLHMASDMTICIQVRYIIATFRFEFEPDMAPTIITSC